jgi:hypothetical protein
MDLFTAYGVIESRADKVITAAEYFCNFLEGCLLRSFGHIDDSIEIELWSERFFNARKSHLVPLWALYTRLIPLVDDRNCPNLFSCLPH